ncbi:hypothetical protein FRC00_005335 [Tulasnella sp. 408]|nr:hypothetical protein FRC00_005335 [Tulasnella sp. 408]
MPDIPKKFGDDAGQFYTHYDELADAMDDDLVASLKTQLDSTLIFAGLFAGVNSAFLALTLPEMKPDPADDTNALLLQLALGSNHNITSPDDLPSASFKPPPGIYPINVLFSVSLTLTLLSSILAVLGQQWVVYYRKREGGGPESERWNQLRRYLGAKRWRLELVLNNLVPGLLLLGLVIFCIAFSFYLHTLSQPLNRPIAALLWVAVGLIVALSACVAFDEWCPFQMPWSRIVRPVACATAAAVTWFGECSFATVLFIFRCLVTVPRRVIAYCRSPRARNNDSWRGISRQELDDFLKPFTTKAPADAYTRFLSVGIRSPESNNALEAKALERVICTSEEHRAWISAAINLQTIWDDGALSSLAKSRDFCTQLSQLYREALDGPQRGQTGGGNTSIESRVFSTSFSHFLITTGSVPEIAWSTHKGNSEKIIITLGNLSIGADEMRNLSRASMSSAEGCDQCSHCVSLRFCMKILCLIVDGLESPRQTSFSDAFKDVVGALAQTEGLKLGCVVASVIISSRDWSKVKPLSLGTWQRSEVIDKLFKAYRSRSESDMFERINQALITDSTQWEGKPDSEGKEGKLDSEGKEGKSDSEGKEGKPDWEGKPDHEIYLRLFELCLSPGRAEITTAHQRMVLERVDDHLLSIERRIRDKNATEADRQLGRNYQIRYIQAVADFVKGREESSQYV